MDKILENMQRILQERGVSRTSVQKACGIAPATWTLWYSRNTPPKTQVLEKIIEYLQVEPNDIFGYPVRGIHIIKEDNPEIVEKGPELSVRDKLLLKGAETLTDEQILSVLNYMVELEASNFDDDTEEETDD